MCTSFIKLKSSNIDSVLLKLKDVILDPGASSQNQHIAAIEVKNTIMKCLANQENPKHKISPGTLKIFSDSIYPMIKQTHGQQLCVQLIEVLKYLCCSDSINTGSCQFDTESFLGAVESDLKGTQHTLVASECLKNVLKTNSKVFGSSKPPHSAICSKFSERVLQMLKSACLALVNTQATPDYELWGNLMKCQHYLVLENPELKFVKKVFYDADWVRIFESVLQDQHFKYVILCAGKVLNYLVILV